MRSRAARLTVGAAAWLALGAAAFLLFRFETQIAGLGVSAREFDQRALDTTAAVAELRAAQQAYVAAGQGVSFWMPKVASTSETIRASIAGLRDEALDANSRAALDDASATMTEFASIDKRVRDYVGEGEALMAADVIFKDGGAAASAVARQIDIARLAARVANDVTQAALRKQQAVALGASALLVGLLVVVLIPVQGADSGGGAPGLGLGLDTAVRAEPSRVPLAVEAPKVRPAPELKVAAALVTDLGRVRDVQDLPGLLSRGADMLDASGLIVWVGNTAGADLKPVLAHGYPPQVLARIQPVPRSAQNAAAAAYRSGTMQIVLTRPGDAAGAVVAPLISMDGCIGALSAEIRGGAETSESVQALTAILAAQLANVVAPEAEAGPDRAAATS
jgi:hypothetical protein